MNTKQKARAWDIMRGGLQHTCETSTSQETYDNAREVLSLMDTAEEEASYYDTE